MKVYCTLLEDFVPECRFDLVLLMHVLEHLRDMGACLNKVHELSGEDGFLYVETPNMFQSGVPRDLEKFLLVNKLYSFTPLTLERLLARHGFAKVQLDERSDKHMFGLFEKVERRVEFVLDSAVEANCQQLFEYLEAYSIPPSEALSETHRERSTTGRPGSFPPSRRLLIGGEVPIRDTVPGS